MDCRKTRAIRFTVQAIAASGVMLVAGGAAAQEVNDTPINSNLPPGAKPSSWDPTYNVCRGPDPKCYHNWVDDRQMRVLVYSRTGGPRHANIGTALGPGRNTQNGTTFAVTCTARPTAGDANANRFQGNCLDSTNTAQQALRTWLNAEGIAVDITEDVTQLGGSQYRAIIFMSPTRDTMWKHGTAANPPCATTATSNSGCNTNLTSGAHLDSAKTALRQYMRAGGGFVGIHNAFGTEYNWPYYEGLLGNANYYDHGANQAGTAHVVGTDPSTAGLPASFQTVDEWYNLMPYPTNVKHVLRLDETSLANRRETHPGHGNFHPVSWCQYYDGGRSWVTTLGHDRRHFIDGDPFPGQANFKKHIVQGIKSAMGLTPFCQ